MENHVAAGVEAFPLTLEEETCLIRHSLDTNLHFVETNHLIQFANTLVVCGYRRGELGEVDIFICELGYNAFKHHGQGAFDVSRTDILDHETFHIHE